MKARVQFVDPERRMNKQEAQYAQYLELLRKSLQIIHWSYESIKLRLADRTWYTPDFLVINARVKIKVAAEQYPMFRFKAVKPRAKKRGGGYDVEEFS